MIKYIRNPFRFIIFSLFNKSADVEVATKGHYPATGCTSDFPSRLDLSLQHIWCSVYVSGWWSGK